MSDESYIAARDAVVARFRMVCDSLCGQLSTASEHAAETTPPDGGWTAAQIGFHVGTVHRGMSRIFAPDSTVAVKLDAAQQPRPWRELRRLMPAKAQAPEVVSPPAHVSRHDGLERLTRSSEACAGLIAELSEDRARHYGWRHPLAGLFSLLDAAEWAVNHAERHEAQMRRTLAAIRSSS